MFNWGTNWEGEEPVPFANFIYHGAISWNSGSGRDAAAILEGLIQGGGSGLEWPMGTFVPAEAQTHVAQTPWAEVLDSLYLVHMPYLMLRDCKWTDFRKNGSLRRVDYGSSSHIEVDDAKPGYEVVVDGKLIAKNFVTVFDGWKKGTLLAYSRDNANLDWTAPKGWKNGEIRAVALTESGDGVRIPAEIKNGRLHLALSAHQPVRISANARAK